MVLGVQAFVNHLTLLFVAISCLSAFGLKKTKVQRGIVTQSQAIVYIHPNFDAKQIARLDKNTVVAISTTIYRPKNLFGSFYRVYLNRPKKIRGYISEIDVMAQFNSSGSKNSSYAQKEKLLKDLKNRSVIQANPVQKKQLDSESQSLDKEGDQKIEKNQTDTSKADQTDSHQKTHPASHLDQNQKLNRQQPENQNTRQ